MTYNILQTAMRYSPAQPREHVLKVLRQHGVTVNPLDGNSGGGAV